eukprot:6214069-Pleurochrysis_carterae.AAC.3
MQRKLSVEETAAICNETSGMLGHAVRRHLKECGIDVASKAAVQSYFQESWESYETGMVTLPNPKRRGKLLTGGWLRVSNLLQVMQRMMDRFFDKGKLSWKSNIPGNECWFELIIDKGSSATKLVLKYCCIDFPDSVRNVSLVGILDRVKDVYEMIIAFKPIFDQVNKINAKGSCVWPPWRQAMPIGIKAAAADGKPMFVWQQDNSTAPPGLPSTAPPSDPPPRFPDCGPCGKWGRCGCPSKRKRAHYANGIAPALPDLYGDGPGLTGSTFSAVCAECASKPEEQLRACRRQWEQVSKRGHGWRRARIFFGG